MARKKQNFIYAASPRLRYPLVCHVSCPLRLANFLSCCAANQNTRSFVYVVILYSLLVPVRFFYPYP